MTKWRERWLLRRAKRAHGMTPELRRRTNDLLRSADLPTVRRLADRGD